MTEWHGKARELVPELGSVIDQEPWSAHLFLTELVGLTFEAHRADNAELLDRAYGFAAWCLAQPGRFLANAAIVGFYEHLFDEWDLREQVAARLPARVIRHVRPMWEWRLPAARLAEVDKVLADYGPPTELASRDVG